MNPIEKLGCYAVKTEKGMRIKYKIGDIDELEDTLTKIMEIPYIPSILDIGNYEKEKNILGIVAFF